MNFKQLLLLVLFFCLCASSNIFAEDLKIEEGKNLKFDFKGSNDWYDDQIIYDNVNIGAGSKVVLGSEWQYVFVSSNTETKEGKWEKTENPDGSVIWERYDTATTQYNYRNDENIATLSVADGGTITLNAGSELSLRNQYSLVTSTTQDVSFEYGKNKDTVFLKNEYFSDQLPLNLKEYYSYDENGELIGVYDNRDLSSSGKLSESDVFKGDIVFEGDDADTVLTFQEIASEQSEDYILPLGSASTEHDVIIASGTIKITETDSINDISVGKPAETNNIVTMVNDFRINSNRSVFNVVSTEEQQEFTATSRQVRLMGLDYSEDKSLNSYITGDGVVVKKGNGALNLVYNQNVDFVTGISSYNYVDATGLTGLKTGYGWSIEEGMVVAHAQENLGDSKIFIDSAGTLGLSIKSIIDLNNVVQKAVFDPLTIISDVKNDSLFTNKFSNDIKVADGEISIATNSNIELSGNIETAEGSFSNVRFTFDYDSALVLSGENNAENFTIRFGGLDGGESNYLITDVDGLASNSISVANVTDEKLKEFAFFELVLNEDQDKEYSGSLSGDMYLHKLGDGIVTLTGQNTYTEGTYISEGGILLGNSNAIGTGKILFDGGVRGSSATYASLGVSSTTSGIISLENEIHVNNGAILNVYENQTLSLKGALVSYDARPGYETEFVKTGLGKAEIAGTSDTNREINISSFTVQEGGFRLDDKVVLDSYFSLNGQQAYLEMAEGAGVTGNVDINNGDLIIFNENNISTATVKFFNSSETEFSKLHTTSNTVLSGSTLQNQIYIEKGIDFVVDATTTANVNAFNFNAGDSAIINKSGDGEFIFNTNNANFVLSNLNITGGYFVLETSTMTVSSATVVDGGILSLKQGSYFSSGAAGADKKITVLSGGIGIYDDNNIDEDTLLSFEGMDGSDLSRLIVEADNVNLNNDIYVKTGVIIANSKNLTLSGESITYDPSSPGIFAKDGAGTMTIAQTSGGLGFNMGEIRVLGGLMKTVTDVTVSTLVVTGSNTIMNINNSSTTVSKSLSVYDGGTLELSTASLTAANIDLLNASLKIDTNSVINASQVNINSNAFFEGYGTVNGKVNANSGSSLYVGKKDDIAELTLGNTNFNSGSSLYVDVQSVGGIKTSDKLDVAGNLSVSKDVNLYVNMLGSETEYATTKSFEIISFTGDKYFENSVNEIFKIILSNARFSASTSLLGKSIFLDIAQEWSLYTLPGATENQQSVMTALNDIYSDSVTKEIFKATLDKMDTLYGEYRETGDSTAFVNAMQDLSGIFYANSFMSSSLLSKTNMIYSRLSDFSEERPENNIWAQVYTHSHSIDKNENNPKFENSISGLIAGFDTVKVDDFILGLSGFYGTGEFKQLEDKADVTDAGVNAYASYQYDENIEVKGLVGYGIQNYDATRKIRFIDQDIKSEYAVNSLQFDAEVSYKYPLSDTIVLKPLIGANCTVVSNNEITEDGNLEQKLKIDAGNYTKAEIRAGAGIQSSNASKFNWYASVVAKQIVDGDKFTMTASFVSVPSEKFEIESTKLSTTVFSGSIGGLYSITNNVNVFLDLSSDTSSTSSMLNGNIGASYKW